MLFISLSNESVFSWSTESLARLESGGAVVECGEERRVGAGLLGPAVSVCASGFLCETNETKYQYLVFEHG